MEHSLLHALQLSGAVAALGGALLMLAFVIPSLARSSGKCDPPLAAQLEKSAELWSFRGGAIAVVAAALNVLVDVAEIDGQTVFGGVRLEVAWRFVTTTSVGHLSLLRLGALLVTTAAVRIRGRAKWGLVLVGGVATTIFEGLICHAAAQPAGRLSAIAFELLHISAASFWIGVLIHLLLARGAIVSSTDNQSLEFLANIIRRFSPTALTGAGLLAVSGLLLTLRYVCTPGALPTSAYGLTLMIKMAMLLPLLYAGYINYRVILPGLQRVRAADSEEQRRNLLSRFGKTLELEVTGGVLVLTMAGILASISPPGHWGLLRLTAPQIRAMMSPHLPPTVVADPASFYGAPERTLADLHYSEFTHNWSGAMVILLGSSWLLAALGGRVGNWAEKAWPYLLIPFPFFIAVTADPEVWLLRKVTFAQTIRDPQLLEHQLGAMLAFIVVGLGWLDRRRPPSQRPLGYSLPVVMILGSLLLLGHAHSNFTSTQELTNLINVQHAVFGAFGLFAGVVRWLSLRGLLPPRPAALVWPGFVIGLGLFMAFCYREAV